MSHENITFDELVELAAGETASERRRTIEAAIAASPRDAARLARLQLILATMREDDSVAPPESTLARARSIFRARAADKMSWIERVEHIVARLVFDSFAQPAAAGIRGDDDARQLSYEWPGATLDLQVDSVPDEPGRRLIGQSTLDRVDDTEVALVPSGTGVAIADAALDAHGVFTLRASAGRYDLYVRAGANVIRIPDIEIR